MIKDKWIQLTSFYCCLIRIHRKSKTYAFEKAQIIFSIQLLRFFPDTFASKFPGFEVKSQLVKNEQIHFYDQHKKNDIQP